MFAQKAKRLGAAKIGELASRRNSLKEHPNFHLTLSLTRVIDSPLSFTAGSTWTSQPWLQKQPQYQITPKSSSNWSHTLGRRMLNFK